MNKKRLWALLLTVAMLVPMLSACGKGEEKQESVASSPESVVESSSTASNSEKAPEEEEVVLKILMKQPDTVVYADEIPPLEAINEQAGVKTEFEFIKASEWDTKINLILATGEYPDIIIARGGMDSESFGVQQKIFLPLDDLIQEHMPIYAERIAEAGELVNGRLIASDGQMYALGFYASQAINVPSHHFINQDWLDALKLDTPTDVEGLTEVFRAFKGQDLNGNGKADEIPYTAIITPAGSYMSIYHMLNLFGLPYDYNTWAYIDDNKEIQFTPTQDSYREFMEWLHLLYDEGLMDVEVISQDENMIKTKLNESRVGYFAGWRLTGYEPAPEQFELYVPGEGAVIPRMVDMASQMVYLTSTNEHVEKSCEWLETYLETENMVSMYNGAQNQEKDPTKPGWYYDENGLIATMSKPKDMTAQPYFGNYGLFYAPDQYTLDTLVQAPARVEKTNFCKIYEEAGLLQEYSNSYLRIARMSNEESQEIALMKTELDSAISEYSALFIKDGVTDANWKEFCDILKGIGADKYLQIYRDTTVIK